MAMLLTGIVPPSPGAAQAEPGDLYDVPDLRRLQNTFASLADETRPTVVSIRTYRTLSVGSEREGSVPIRMAEDQGSSPLGE